MIKSGAAVAIHTHLAGCQVWTLRSQPLGAHGGMVDVQLGFAVQRKPVGIDVGIVNRESCMAAGRQFINDAVGESEVSFPSGVDVPCIHIHFVQPQTKGTV